MSDYILFIIGIISTILLMWINIYKFRNNEYNPTILIKRQESVSRISGLRIGEFISFFGFLIGICFIHDSFIKSIYALITWLLFLIIFTALNIMSFKKNKSKSNIIQTAVFDIIMIGGLIMVVKFVIN